MEEQAQAFIAGLGGNENVTFVEACITRMRVEVDDTSLVDDVALREAGAYGVVLQKNVVQIIVGPIVDDLVAAIESERS